MTTVTQIERHLRHALLHAGVMPYGLYEYELEELLDELKASLAADHDDYIFGCVPPFTQPSETIVSICH